MAYLIFKVKGRELGRRQLQGPLVIGRSTECDVCVHDILLSRQHCRFEPEAGGWVLVDLASKNGTFLDKREVGRHALSDGESVRIGKTTVTFCAGKIVPPVSGGRAARRPNRPAITRPADPWEAMAGTVSGFNYLQEKLKERQKIGGHRRREDRVPAFSSRLPSPQPSPRDPQAYENEDIYSMLSELASSSWDSIYMTNKRPAATRPAPRPIVHSAVRHPRGRNIPTVDLSLALPVPTVLTPIEELAAAASLLPKSPTHGRPRSRKRRVISGVARGMKIMIHLVILLTLMQLFGGQ